MFGVFFLLLLFLLPCPASAQELSVYTEELPPLNYSDAGTGQAGGFSVCIVRELMARTGIRPVDNKIKVYPWARAMKIVENQPDTMLFSMTRTQARENRFKWVGPIADRTVWLWKLRERKEIRVSSLEEAKKYKTGGVYKFAMSEYLESRGFILDMANDVEQNWKKLMAHRIDLGPATEIEAIYYMKKMGLEVALLEKLIKVDDRYKFYIALNRKTPDELIQRLQNALDLIKSDGTYDRLKDSCF